MTKPIIYSQDTKPKNFFEALQTAVINRYTKSFGGNEPIVYEFTQDRALLHQYYRLREIMYRKVFNTEQFNGEEDLHDKLSHILVARRGRLCLGGCRLTIREGDEMWNLPMESDDFKLRHIFKDSPLTKVRHGEISRFAIMDDNGDNSIFYGLCKVMYEKVINSEVHFLFAKSTFPLARNWRLIANSFGVKTTRICHEIDVPENPIHPMVKWCLTMSDLSSAYMKTPEAMIQSEASDSKNTPEASPLLALVE